MSILGAMYSAVSGLGAQSTKLGVISDNIANSSTTGYKRSEVQFSSLVTQQISNHSYSSGGVQSDVRRQVDKQGLLQSTSSNTDIAINGGGLFAVSDTQNADPSQDLIALTRAGSFTPDDQGFLRNAAGYYLMGWQLNPDGTTVNPAPARDTFASLEPVNISGINFTGAPTVNMTFAGNLPAQLANGTPGTPIRTDIEYFNDLGVSNTLTLQWTPSADGVANDWGLQIFDSATGGGTTPVYDQIVTFNPNGPNAGSPSSIPGVAGGLLALAVDGGAQNINLNIGDVNSTSGITQFAGEYTPTKITKDGALFGVVNSVEVDEKGVITAIFNNGSRRPIYQIPIAVVQNPNGLTARDGTAFVQSRDSGSLYLWDAGTGPAGKTAGDALEQSNVDIATELTNMIETQRTYSTNAKVIQTADEMLQELTQLKR
ncbi:MAG TPA: flagellar hook protein FlgE [Candidatus Acidoferrum sp.]|nr:flagellar hook protein FlgE [Candidatus Acidoferrum sp.]